MASPSTHAFLGASNAHRWLACTAAPHFEAQFPNTESEYAKEGTLAHAICEIAAKRAFILDADRKQLTREMNKLKKDPLYSDEMLESAAFYTEYLKQKAAQYDSDPYVVTEVKVDLSDYIPEGFGTCDCVMIGGTHLHITDYKNGIGVRVDAENNPQMRLYALGALKRYAPLYTIETISMGICQPRITHDPSEEFMTVDELLAWGESIKPVALEAYTGPGHYVPGEHCKFCRGAGCCKARADANSALADFADLIPADEATNETPADNIITDDRLAELLRLGADIKDWYNSLCAYAQKILLDGRNVPGWKVVAGKSNRAFKDTEAAINILREAGYPDDTLYDVKAKSITALEKAIGKKKFGELVGGEIVKPTGSPTLVPESDKRPPYSQASADFKDVTE